MRERTTALSLATIALNSAFKFRWLRTGSDTCEVYFIQGVNEHEVYGTTFSLDSANRVAKRKGYITSPSSLASPRSSLGKQYVLATKDEIVGLLSGKEMKVLTKYRDFVEERKSDAEAGR